MCRSISPQVAKSELSGLNGMLSGTTPLCAVNSTSIASSGVAPLRSASMLRSPTPPVGVRIARRDPSGENLSTIRSWPAAHSSMRFSPVSISKMNHPGNLGDSVKPRALQAVVAGQLRAGDVVRLPAGEWVFV